MQPPPPQFGKYVLLEPLAKGGMAETYRARFTGPAGVTKDVVIKRILPVFASDKSFVQMFVNEAKIATTLSHGNIAQVFDFGEIDGQFFLAMELVDGQSLLQILRRTRQLGLRWIPEPIAVLIAMRVCEGLHYAHTRVAEDGRPLGIVHRDVTPENVLISYEGQIKLVDFGIAKARTGHNATEPGMVKGKYLYMSPEQARGETVDARSDIYTAGVVLYSMLCGRLPFEGEMVQVMHQIASAEVPAPRTFNPRLSPELERILLRALARNREERYPTAQELAEALSSYLYGTEPTFSQTRLASFMAYLFEPALAAEGRTVELPEEFQRQMQGWRQTMDGETAPVRRTGQKSRPEPHPAPMHPEVTVTKRVAAPDGETLIRTAPVEVPVEVPEMVTGEVTKPLAQPHPKETALLRAPLGTAELRSLRRSAWPWLLGGVFLVALVVPLSLVVYWTNGVAEEAKASVPSPGPTASSPPGATPAPPKAAPAPTEAAPAPTEAARPAGEGTAKPDGAPTAPTAGVAESPDGGEPEPGFKVVKHRANAGSAEPPGEAVYPVSSFKVVASKHRISVADDSHASFLQLDPAERYRLWTEGSLKLDQGTARSTRSVFYVLRGADGAPDVVGLASPRPVVIEHASALYGLVVDPRWDDNSGTVTLRVQALGKPRQLRLPVDARKNALELSPRHRFLLSGLDAHQRYELAVRPVVVSAGERPGKVVCISTLRDQDALTDGQEVLEPGGRYKVSGAEAVQCAFLDAGGEAARGALELEVHPMVSVPDRDEVQVLRHTRGGR